MKRLQDKYHYDSAILGLDGIYIPCADTSFYINSQCIQTYQNKIWTGNTYIIIWSLPNAGFDPQMVTIKDIFCDNVRINLDVQEVLTQKQFTINFDFRNVNQCTWKLVDGYQWQEDDLLAIEDYCGCK
jgi:hypothetical protein